MASGRLGYKCIPAYSACEIYVNSSGSSASVSVVSQVNSSSDSSKFSTAITTGAITLQSSSNVIAGTNCFCQAIGFNLYFDNTTAISDDYRYKPCAAYIRGPENCYSRINKYVNSTTTTCGANSTQPAPYGGNEVILPSDGNQIPTIIGRQYFTASPNCVVLGFDCTGCFPHVIIDKAYCSNRDTSAQLFTNPYCDCGCTCTGFSLATYGFCSIEYTRCVYTGYCSIDAFVVNHYSDAFLGCSTCSMCTREFCCRCCYCGICNCGVCYCCIEQCSQGLCCSINNQGFQAIAIGIGSASNGCCAPVIYYNKFSTIVNTCPTAGCACCIPFSPCVCCFLFSTSNVNTEYIAYCKNISTNIRFITKCSTCISPACWCNNTTCGNAMSPYGVQRAATRCAMVWAFCNGVDSTYCFCPNTCCLYPNPQSTTSNRTGYFLTFPNGLGCSGCHGEAFPSPCVGWGAFGTCCTISLSFGCCQVVCSDLSIGIWLTIESPHCCEYPIKYLSYNPNDCLTYMMIRSSEDTPWKTGIYRLYCAYSRLTCKPANCNMCILIHDSMPYLQEICSTCTLELKKCLWGLCTTGVRVASKCPAAFCRVGDFPEVMSQSKYTSPLMCVSCLFKTKSDTWTMALYNHCTCKWDPYITNDLIDWKCPGNESIFDFNVNETTRYLVNDSCIELRTNQFYNNAPQCSIIDYDVNANNLERTGLVISNGDRIVVNNTGATSASVQVWGYEG